MTASARVMTIPQPPPQRGRLLNAAGIQALFPEPRPSLDWIYNHVPYKLKMGRRSFWWERDVLAWLDTLGDHETASA